MSDISFSRGQLARSLSFRAAPWWVKCIGLWLALLIVLNCVGLIASQLFDLGDGIMEIIPPDRLPGLWTRYDSSYYLQLALDGYGPHPTYSGFFPLFPLLMTALSRVTGLPLAWSGLIIAQTSYLLAILVFYKLALKLNNDESYAWRCVLYMVLFPTSLFFVAVYAESVYLALAILSCYLLLSNPPRYMSGGLVLGLAFLARPVGWLLGIIAGIEFLLRRDFRRSTIISAIAGLCLAAVGIVIFVLYLRTLTGSVTAITDAQSLWKRTWQWPWLTVWDSIKLIFAFDLLNSDWFTYLLNIVDLAFTLFAIGLTLAAARLSYLKKLPWSLTLFLAGSLIFLLSRRGFWVPVDEMGRWVAPLFPMYLVLGKLTEHRPRAQWILIFISSGLLLAFTAWFATGRWIG